MHLARQGSVPFATAASSNGQSGYSRVYLHVSHFAFFFQICGGDWLCEGILEFLRRKSREKVVNLDGEEERY